ncbi:YhgE/Pip domain-containing protein [Salinibacterium sp. UTAS2018]|uniref:YhgE/Pip domain-containing protein n=1 Tax=Salinibacterium sp. UTAS2018 TaxID=2508880 RepID=UPI001009586E|nr:YhgE/Pip domain-containing protein [Salinibacterium sp. UTAS2018]QAV70820.1 YhgE/Pip domain-containing protein [Salinibacterium sp. UTAS2018]
MKVPSMIAAELRRLTSSRMGVLALLALMLVPVLYGGVYLWANQDPYGSFTEVPVGLVVADDGVAADGDDAAVNYGEEVAKDLLAGNDFDWHVLSPADAQTALAEGNVDFTVTIPSDFSDALRSIAGTDPHQAEIDLETNDANNYLASTIGKQAVEQIRRSVAELVGEEAAGTLLTAISDIRGELSDAADGASQLLDGSRDATSGAGELADGASTLTSGLTELSSATESLASGADKLSAGAAQVADGNTVLAGYADRAGTAAQTIADALPTARADLITALTEQGLDTTEIEDVLTALDPLSDRIAEGNGTVQSAVSQVDELAAGANTLASSAATLASGAEKIATATDAATSGASQLSDGVSTLEGGLSTLADGTAELRDGLASGVTALPDSSSELRALQAEAIADPVAVESSAVTKASNYGAGLAPFFAALAGWIGIYALFLIVKPVSKRAVTALRSPIRITLAGWLTPAVLGAIQMVALFGVLAIALGFTFTHPLGTLGVMVAASFTYAAIILALNIWFGSVGQFLGLVLMVLQLVTAGGTFPWQTLPAPLAALHHVLPMGYVVDAMRQLMYGGDLARVGTDAIVLGAWLAGALILAAIGVTRMTHRRTLRDLQPSLIG